MAFKSRESIDMDKLASFLQDAVEKVKTQEDPVELNEVKKVFKQNVPLTLRSYVAAYMLKSVTGFSAKPSKGFKKQEQQKPAVKRHLIGILVPPIVFRKKTEMLPKNREEIQ
ncbi:MAG TPA: hypothetical protein PLG87_09215 [Treponemataceae bacterium]|nr:hypothetical protein [Treponemataceae bacterium]